MSSSKEAFGPSPVVGRAAVPRGARGAGGDFLVRGDWPCPVCGTRGRWWCRLTRDGCFAWCRNVSVGAVSTTTNAGGDEYIHRLDGERRARAEVVARAAPAPSAAQLAPAALDAMHCYLLAVHLRLPDWVRAFVRDRRGLTDDEITAEGYGYMPREGRKRIAAALLERFGDDAMRLPGMRVARDESTGAEWPTLGGAVGLVVPCRSLVDDVPLVTALKVRATEDDVQKERRFTYVSSNRHGGCPALVGPHYPRRSLDLRAQGRRDVVLVESELAATVFANITGHPAVAVAGVSNALRFGPEVARAWGADVVRVALDRDPKPSTRAKVSAVARDLLRALASDGFDARLLEWPEPHKGPDDFARARHRPRITDTTGNTAT